MRSWQLFHFSHVHTREQTLRKGLLVWRKCLRVTDRALTCFRCTQNKWRDYSVFPPVSMEHISSAHINECDAVPLPLLYLTIHPVTISPMLQSSSITGVRTSGRRQGTHPWLVCSLSRDTNTHHSPSPSSLQSIESTNGLNMHVFWLQSEPDYWEKTQKGPRPKLKSNLGLPCCKANYTVIVSPLKAEFVDILMWNHCHSMSAV